MDPETGYDDRNVDEEDSFKELDRDDESTRSEDNDDDDNSSEDEKQMEDDTPNLKELQAIVKKIKRNKEIDWDKPKEFFGGKHQGPFSAHLTDLAEGSQDCILHLLVKDDEATSEETKELAKAIKFIVRFHPKLMTTLNKQSLTPLYCALDNLDRRRAYLIKNGFFKSPIKSRTKDDTKDDQLAKVIGTSCGLHQENCLHRALKSQPVNYAVLNLLVARANRQSVNAKDGQDWTPLHRAVQYEHSSEEMLGIIEKLINIGEPDSAPNGLDSLPAECAFDTYSGPGREKLSVYEYHLKTREEEEQREQRERVRAAKSSSSSAPKPKEGRGDLKHEDQANKNRQQDKESKKGGEIQDKDSKIGRETQHRGHQKENENTNQGRPIRKERGDEEEEAGQEDMPKPVLMRANTNAKRVTFPDNNTNAKQTEKRDTKAEKRQERERWSQKIRDALKLYCLRTRTIAQATRFLYGTNKEDVQLFFDYSGLPKEDADPGTFYDNFQTTQFDEVLKYVEFPAVRLKVGKIPRGETFREHRALYHAKTIGRKDLLFFFSWLRDKGVKHIIKVIVQDSTDPHCDEVIEKCLASFRIDVLDWSKPDLDPEMLCNACPDVKELHLRWGGNNAVLRSWGEQEGLRRLKDLRTIYLYHDQTSDYTKQNVEKFRKRIATAPPVSLSPPVSSVTVNDEATKENGESIDSTSIFSLGKQIEVLIAHDHARTHLQTPGTTTSEARTPSKPSFTVHKWLESIDMFAAELKTLMDKIGKAYHSGDEVTVALIDDGVDICEKAFRDRIIHGKSLGYYWDGDQGDQRAKQWYVSETGHGTVMAHMILRVCPMAKIYPIKLDIAKDTKGMSRIKPESAAAAIDAAVEKGVHIISMSWTVNEPQDGRKTRLDEALSNASKKGILMFCSSPDEGVYGGDHYPTAYGPDKFFRIGASQADGHPYSWVLLDKVDYLFPGVDVVQANKKDIRLRGVEDRKGETGSSISTALAAGLAALVIWFVIIGAKYSWDENQGGVGGDGLDANDVKTIQHIKEMKQAFKKLGASRESNEKFIEIWSVLDDRARALKELHGDQNVKAARQVIHKLARNLIVKT